MRLKEKQVLLRGGDLILDSEQRSFDSEQRSFDSEQRSFERSVNASHASNHPDS